MPVIDFRCKNGHVESHFIPASKCGNDHPESERNRCSICRCRSERIYDDNGNGRTTTVGFKVPPVVHFNPKTGEYAIPGHPDEPVDRGYKRVEIRDMRSYNRVVKAINAVEKEKAQFLQAAEREYFDQTVRTHRDEQRQRIEAAISKGGHYVQETDAKGITRTRWAPISPRARQLFDIACKRADAKREQIRRKRESGDANFHSRLLEFRESERSIVSGTAKRPELPDPEMIRRRLEGQR